MSGIDELKNKTKLSLDDMYEDPTPGNMGSHNKIKPTLQVKDIQNEKEIHSPVSTIGMAATYQLKTPITNQPSHVQNQPQRRQEALAVTQIESEMTAEAPTYPIAKKRSEQIPSYKMTFSLTKEIYTAFNDLYAKRMLQGRKTEKSDLICEAIYLLIQKEEGQL